MNDRPRPVQRRPESAQRVFEGVLFEVWQWSQALRDGSVRVFETLSRPDTAIVLPVLPNGDVLLGVEEQPGVGKMFRSLGGRVEVGETPAEAARREIFEECGCVVTDLRLWDAWHPVNKLDWVVWVFIAQAEDNGLVGVDSADERIRLVRIPSTHLLRPDLVLDDREVMYLLYRARSNKDEEQRLRTLLLR